MQEPAETLPISPQPALDQAAEKNLADRKLAYRFYKEGKKASEAAAALNRNARVVRKWFAAFANGGDAMPRKRGPKKSIEAELQLKLFSTLQHRADILEKVWTIPAVQAFMERKLNIKKSGRTIRRHLGKLVHVDPMSGLSTETKALISRQLPRGRSRSFFIYLFQGRFVIAQTPKGEHAAIVAKRESFSSKLIVDLLHHFHKEHPLHRLCAVFRRDRRFGSKGNEYWPKILDETVKALELACPCRLRVIMLHGNGNITTTDIPPHVFCKSPSKTEIPGSEFAQLVQYVRSHAPDQFGFKLWTAKAMTRYAEQVLKRKISEKTGRHWFNSLYLANPTSWNQTEKVLDIATVGPDGQPLFGPGKTITIHCDFRLKYCLARSLHGECAFLYCQSEGPFKPADLFDFILRTCKVFHCRGMYITLYANDYPGNDALHLWESLTENPEFRRASIVIHQIHSTVPAEPPRKRQRRPSVQSGRQPQ